MKKKLKKLFFRNVAASEDMRRAAAGELLAKAAAKSVREMMEELGTDVRGLNRQQVEAREREGNINRIAGKNTNSIWKRIADAFINPFTGILAALAAVSLFTDILWANPGEKDASALIIILIMVAASGLLRFVQETRSGNAAVRLSHMVKTTACVQRAEQGKQEIPAEQIVMGDVIHLAAGDIIPADLRIISEKNLLVSQSALTGESEPVRKQSLPVSGNDAGMQFSNIAFMGSSVVSGSATGIAVAVGENTLFGDMTKQLSEKPPKTNFEKAIHHISLLLIRFMLIMAPVVFLLNGFARGDWMAAGLFAVSVAVGLTPEMLPMIVTTCLAKGAVVMSEKKVVIKNLNAIQNLGSMDILCTDKTGTLTKDQVVLESCQDVFGEKDDRVLRHAFLNSYYQTGLRNLTDIAVIRQGEERLEKEWDVSLLKSGYSKTDEIPFDFERRTMSVVLKDEKGKQQMITKGAVEEILRICTHVEYNGKVKGLTEERKAAVLQRAGDMNQNGMRVLAVAQKNVTDHQGPFCVEDEADMVLMGYLAFLDPPKETAAPAVQALMRHGVGIKVLTGDNEKVAEYICREVGLPSGAALLGQEIDEMDDGTLAVAAERTSVFAKLSPPQKARLVRVLRENGHCVGFMGDGINDAVAMKDSDVGISVDTAVDIAREAADVILLEKDLSVLEQAVLEGRRTYANTMKYIKITASSNFGNMLSVLAASAFLPFLPMAAIQLILLNLIYDLSCTALPWDCVDRELLERPCRWEGSGIGSFMVWMGPVSSLLDIATYLALYFVICPAVCGGTFHTLTPAAQGVFIAVFQAGWFVESMWSQSLVIHMMRTSRIPFLQSRASFPVTALTLSGMAALTAIPFTAFGLHIGLTALPAVYFLWLSGILFLYLVLVSLMKKIYVKRYDRLL